VDIDRFMLVYVQVVTYPLSEDGCPLTQLEVMLMVESSKRMGLETGVNRLWAEAVL
jgi:hypothetical protein